MGRPPNPKPELIKPLDALHRLIGRYGGTNPRDVVEDALSDIRTGQRSGQRDGDDVLVLDALAVLPLLRDQLDAFERELLRIGHEELGMAMSQLAPALGVKTRQAAEQRYQRRVNGATGANLSGARRKRFDAWATQHETEIVAAVRDVLTAVNGHADEMKESGYGPSELWYFLQTAHTVATLVNLSGDADAPEVVAKAGRVLDLYRQASNARAASAP